jgi:hypothetical protein
MGVTGSKKSLTPVLAAMKAVLIVRDSTGKSCEAKFFLEIAL